MEKKKKAKPGPKPTIHNEEVADFLIRKFPVSLRNKAKSKAADQGIMLREFVIATLTEKVNS